MNLLPQLRWVTVGTPHFKCGGFTPLRDTAVPQLASQIQFAPSSGDGVNRIPQPVHTKILVAKRCPVSARLRFWKGLGAGRKTTAHGNRKALAAHFSCSRSAERQKVVRWRNPIPPAEFSDRGQRVPLPDPSRTVYGFRRIVSEVNKWR